VDRRDDILVFLDQPRALGNRPQQRMLVDVVQLILAPRVAAYAARNDQQRDAVEERLADTAGRMRDARRGHDDQGAEARATATDRVGHERATTFVRHQDRSDGRRLGEFIVNLRVVHARDAKGESDADALEGFAKHCSGGTAHVGSCLSSGCGRGCRPRL
jgi:hypothetical protein